ncbi:MAG: hypothetical protein JSS32_05640 [Verrucomicrobia bacterium]|nr:hypothetical protein [Verrucomicrobiota bacterium]
MSTVSRLSPEPANWQWTLNLMEKRALSKSTMEKVALYVANIFVVIAEACKNLLAGTKETSLKDQFSRSFSWEGYFKEMRAPVDWKNVFELTPKTSGDGAVRNQTTDLEMDDVCFFIEELFKLSEHIQKTGKVPRINLLITQGSAALLNLKIATLKIIISYMVHNRMVDERVIDAFVFYTGEPNPIDEVNDPKGKGFVNIHVAAFNFLSIPHADHASLAARFKLGGSFKDLYASQDRALDGRTPAEAEVRELVIAPVENFVRHYGQNNPAHLPFVREEGYGSFNIKTSIEELDKDPARPNEGAKRVMDVFSGCKEVFSLEAFLATREPMKDGATGEVLKDRKGNIQYRDFNKVGMKTDTDILSPILNGQSPLQKFIYEGFRGWSTPVVEKMEKDLREKITGGREFMAEYQPDMPLEAVVKLCHAKVEPAQVEKALVKAKILHSIYENNCVQTTLSDLMFALIKSNPDLVRTEQLSKSKLEIEGSGGRANTVFKAKEGNAYAIMSEGDQTGIDIPRMKEAIKDFFTRLAPLPA